MHNFAHFGLDWIWKICRGEGEIPGKMVFPLRSTDFVAPPQRDRLVGLVSVAQLYVIAMATIDRRRERGRGEEPGAVDMADRMRGACIKPHRYDSHYSHGPE